MAKAQSYDLRQKVIKAIELDGWKKSEVAEMFQISRNTIDLWLKRKQKTGDYRALSNRPHGIKSKITDWQAFEEFVEKHGAKTQAQMAQLWGEPISPRTISRGLKKIGFTRKKKTTDMKKEMKTEETNSKLKQLTLSHQKGYTSMNQEWIVVATTDMDGANEVKNLILSSQEREQEE